MVRENVSLSPASYSNIKWERKTTKNNKFCNTYFYIWYTTINSTSRGMAWDIFFGAHCKLHKWCPQKMARFFPIFFFDHLFPLLLSFSTLKKKDFLAPITILMEKKFFFSSNNFFMQLQFFIMRYFVVF